MTISSMRATAKATAFKRLALSAAISVSTALYAPLCSAVKFQELNAQQLDQMRGKFVSQSGGVVYFGIVMQTTWTTPVVTHSVQMGVEVDASGQHTEMTMTTSGTLGNKVDNDALPEQQPTAADNVSGAVQSIQVASNDNVVENQILVNVSEQTPTPTVESAPPTPPAAPPLESLSAERPTPAPGDSPELSAPLPPIAPPSTPEPSPPVNPPSEVQIASAPPEPVSAPPIAVAPTERMSPPAPAASEPLPTPAPAATVASAPAAEAPPAPATQLAVAAPVVETYTTEQGITTQFKADGDSLGYTIKSGEDVIVQRLGVNPEQTTRQLLQSVSIHSSAQRIVNTIRLNVQFAQGDQLRQNVMKLNTNLLGLR